MDNRDLLRSSLREVERGYPPVGGDIALTSVIRELAAETGLELADSAG